MGNLFTGPSEKLKRPSPEKRVEMEAAKNLYSSEWANTALELTKKIQKFLRKRQFTNLPEKVQKKKAEEFKQEKIQKNIESFSPIYYFGPYGSYLWDVTKKIVECAGSQLDVRVQSSGDSLIIGESAAAMSESNDQHCNSKYVLENASHVLHFVPSEIFRQLTQTDKPEDKPKETDEKED